MADGETLELIKPSALPKRTIIKVINARRQKETHIIECGNCTPLGTRAGITAASVRAGFSMILINSEYEDETWDPI